MFSPAWKKYASILRDLLATTPTKATTRIRVEALEDRLAPAFLTWDGGGSNNQWSTAANWTSDVAPQAGDSLFFPAGAAQLTNVNDLAAGTHFNTVQLGGGGYNLSGNAIQLIGGLTSNHVSGANTVALDITLQNAMTFMNANPGATLNLTSGIHTGILYGTSFFFGSTALQFDGAGSTNVSGVIDGNGSLLKLGSGMLTLSAANTYVGITDVRQGVVVANNNSALGSVTGDTQIQAGAALHITGGRTIGEVLALREGGIGFGSNLDGSTLGALRSISGNNTWTGNIDLPAGNNLIGVNAGSTLTVSGVIANAISTTNRLIKVGAGTLQLAGTADNIIRGEMRVQEGTLELNKTPGNNAFSGNLVIGDHFSGDNAATVRLLANDQIPQLDFFDVGINTITLNSSGRLDFNGFTDTVGNLVLFTGPTYSADVSTGAGTFILGGNLTLNAFQGSSGASPAATISGNLDLGTFFSGGGAGGGIGGTRAFVVNDSALPNIAADLTISANITGSSVMSVTRTGGGTLALTGNNTFSGPFIWNGGIVDVGSNTAFGTGLLSLQNNGNVLRGIGAPRTLANPVSFDGNLTTLGQNLTFTQPLLLTGGRTILTMDETQTVTFAGGMTEGFFGSQAFTKSGRGTLALTGANTHSGSTTVNDDSGTLILSGNGTLPNTTSITVGAGSTVRIDNTTTNLTDRIGDATAVTLNTGKFHYVGSASANSSELVGAFTVNGNQSSTVEMQNTSAGAFSSVVTANTLAVGTDRTINMIGTGVPLSGTGANRFSVVNNPGNLDDAMLVGTRVTSGANVELATLDSSPEGFAIVAYPSVGYVTDLNQASATSNVKITTPGVYTLNTAKTINSLYLGAGVSIVGTGTLTINASTVVFAGNGVSSISVATLNIGNGAVAVEAGMTATINSSIVGTQLNKGGLGTLILTGDNQYTGNTIVNEGVLNIQRSTALGSPVSGTTVRANAVLELEQTTFGPVVVLAEAISINSTGGLTNAGGLRNVAGNNRIAGTVALGSSSVNLLDLYDGFPAINGAAPFINVATGTTLTLTGDVTGSDFVKGGSGTLEFAGVVAKGADVTMRILEGTVLLNNEPGVRPFRGRYLIGSDAPGAPAATLRLGASDQIADDRRVEIFASGLFDLNGFSDVIDESDVLLHVGPTGAGDINIGAGGSLILNTGITVQTIGTGNPVGATITGGTLALQVFGTIAATGTRAFTVNDGAVGNDLTITSAIVDGTGLQQVGLVKTGFGTLELGGTTANTFMGDTIVNEGTLVLNKGTGSGGVNALGGRLFIGDANTQSGYASSDVVRMAQPNQLPDWLAAVELRTTGLLDLNGFAETIGNADAQTALTLQAGSTVDMNGGTLTINGNIASNAANGAAIWTPVVAPQIVDGTLNLGALVRVIDTGADRNELAADLYIGANLVGAGGFYTTNSGTLLLDGNNVGLTGDVIRTNGNLGAGSDTAFGSGRLISNGGGILSFNGPRTLGSNSEILLNGTVIFGAGNGYAGSGFFGGGGNDLKFNTPVTLINGMNPTVPVASQVEFAGGMGEAHVGVFVRQQGPGTVIFSAPASFSGGFEIGQDSGGTAAGFNRINGGTTILRDGGTMLNSSTLVGVGGTLQLDNSGVNNLNRLGDTQVINMSGGTLSLVGKTGAAITEAMGQLLLRDNTSSSVVEALLPDGGSAKWRFSNYGAQNVAAGSNVEFVGRGAPLTTGGKNRIAFTTLPTLADGIITNAVLSGPSGFDFATVSNPTAVPFENYVTALTSGPNFSATLTGATATTNVKLSASEVVGGAITANALLLANGSIIVSGAGSLTLDAGLLASAGVGNSVTVAGLALASDALLFAENGSLAVSSNITGPASSLAKGGMGTVVLSGSNNFNGTVRITRGALRAASNNALSSTANTVTVAYGGTLELGNVSIPTGKTLNLTGQGEANLGHVSLRSVGAATWQGNVSLGNNRTAIDVPAGTSLTIGAAGTTGVISSNGFNKFGTGTLQFAGTASNTFNQTSIVWDGTLELNKTAGVDAIPVMADNTEFFVGNFYGVDNGAVLRSLASNVIGDGPYRLRIMPSGLFDLNGQTDTLIGRTAGGANHDALGIDISGVSSGDVDLNGGTLRIGNTVAENGRVQLRVFSGGMPVPATIADGTLELMGATGGLVRRILVDDSSALEDLVISATIADGGAVASNFIKNNNGRLVLAPTAGGNTFTAPSIIEQGELVSRHANALGSAAAGTTVNNGMSLFVDGVSSAEPLTLNGAGFGNQGAVRNVSGNNALTGAVSLASTATISVNAGQTLNMDGVISGAGGITKLMPGTLQYGGTAANTYTGATSVFEGTLELNKPAGTNALAGTVTVSNDHGPQDADVLRLLQADQIPNNVQVQVTAAGFLNLNGNNETLGLVAGNGLNLFTGVATSARVATGAGVLTLASGTGVTTQPAGNLGTTVYNSPGANIAGNLTLGGNTVFTVNDSGLHQRELVLDATITGTAGLTRSGGGNLVLNNNNAATLSGTVTLNGGGGLVVGNNGGFGAGTVNVAGGTTLLAVDFDNVPSPVNVPNTITLNSDLTLRATEDLTLSGTIAGQGTADRTLTIGVNNANAVNLSGGITLGTDAVARTFNLNNSTYNHFATLNSNVANGAGANHALTKGGLGGVTYTGSSTHLGATNVNGGLLRVTNNNAFGGTVSEQQTFGVTTTTGGSFTITYNGQTTTALAYSGTTPPTDIAVAAALNALPSILRTGGVVSVTSSNPTGPTTTYTVIFGGALSGIDVSTITSINFTAPAAASGAITTTVNGSGGTTVNNGATLQIVPGLNIAEPLTLNNNGFLNWGALRLIDQTPGVTETSTWSGNINFNAGNTTTWVGVDGGGANPDRLILSGTTVSAIGSLAVKTGEGELEFGGLTDNNQTVFSGVSPMDDGLQIRQGTVYFNKPNVSGNNYLAIVGGGAVTVGDGGGGASADRLILIGTSTDQIGGGVPITIAASGSFSQTVATTESLPNVINIERLMGIAGTMNSGPGTFALNNNISVNNAGFTSSTTPAATVAGVLNLNGSRTLTANDSYAISAADDLLVSAQVTNGTLNTGGFGTMALTNGANNYAGGTVVNSTTIDSSTSATNGLNVLVNGTLVARGAGILGTGVVTLNSGGTLVLDNTTGNANRIGDGQTLTNNGGRVTLIGNAGGTTETIGTVTLNAGGDVGREPQLEVNSNAGGVTILQTGSMNRGGSAVAEFIGTGADLGTATNSRIVVTGGSTPFVNNVLPWATVTGPAGTDLVTDADGTAATAPFSIGRVTTYSTDINTGGTVRLNGGIHTLTADRTVDALFLENGATVNGAFTLTVGTGGQGLVVARGANNSIATTGTVGNPGLQFAGREPLFFVDAGSLEVAATINSTNTLRKEGDGTLILSGDNDVGVGQQLTGAISANAGTLVVRNSNALGAEPGGITSVLRRAVLVLDTTAGSLSIGNKQVEVTGLGLNDDGNGALQVIGGNTATIGTGATIVNYRLSPTMVNVAANTTLELNANVSGGQLIKRGAGTLTYSGATANSNGNSVTVNEGTLNLAKTGGVTAINSTLTLNDLGNYDGTAPATVRYTAAGTNQIADGASVVINTNSTLDLNGNSDTIGALTVAGGTVLTGAGTVTLNGAVTISGGTINGNVILNNNITYNSGLGGDSPATISGTLNLNGSTRTIGVNDGPQLNDLTINALISNGAFVKSNVAGTLLLTNSGNTFAGGLTLQGGTLALSHQNALGTGTLSVTGSSTLRPEGANLVVANPISMNMGSGGTFQLGGRSDLDGGFDITLSGPVTLPAPGGATINSFGVIDPNVVAEISGVMSGGNNNFVLGKNGIGRLTISGNNTFDTRDFVSGSSLTSSDGVRLDNGILRLTHSNALGTAANTLTFTLRGDQGAVLEIDGTTANGPVNLTNTVLDIYGNENSISRGYLNRSSPDFHTGILRNIGGTNSIVAPAGAGSQIRLRHAGAANGNGTILVIGSDAGSLNLNGALTGLQNDAIPTSAANKSVYKTGPGALTYSGATSNTINGITAVFDGTLNLNKSGTAQAIAGTLNIGDNTGADDSDQVVYTGTSTDMIGDVIVNVHSTGVLNLGANSDVYAGAGTLNWVIGHNESADVITTTGNVLSTAYNVTVLPGVVTAVPATMQGIFNLGSATKTIAVNDTPAEVDFSVTAQIINNVAGAGVTKSGAGRMLLAPTAASTYDGPTTVSAGALRISNDGALGTATAGTTVNSGAALELTGSFSETDETLALSGVGIINEAGVAAIWNAGAQAIIGSGALRSVNGTNTWASSVTLNSTPAVVRVDTAGTLNLIGVVGGGNALAKNGPGVLELGGAANNTYSGNTYVNEGTLRLNKSGAAVAIDGGEIYIGDNFGGNDADVLIYAATAGTNQIGDQTIRISDTGVLNLNGITDVNNAPHLLDVGPTYSADIVTGAGILRINNTVVTLLQGGTTATSPAATIQGNLDLQNGNRTFDIRDGGALVELSVPAVIQGGGGGGAITKVSRGTLALSGANTYTGGTTLNADSGTLLANTPAGVAASAYTINAGSTLGGTGTITGPVSLGAVGSNLVSGGILNPGPNGDAPNNTGILTVNNNVNFNAGALYAADINGTTAGTQYDQLTVGGAGTVTTTGSGTPSLTNTSLINGTLGTGFLPVNGVDSFKLINKTSAGTISVGANSFLSQVTPTPPQTSPTTVLVGPKTYDTSYNTVVGLNDGNDFVLTAVAGTKVWDGDGNAFVTPDPKWSTPVNWVGDLAPFAGDSLLFGDAGDTRETNTNDFVGYAFGTLVLDKSTGTAYDLQGNAVTLNAVGGGLLQTATDTTNNTISLNLTTSTNPQTITVNSATLLTLGGTLTMNSDVSTAGSGSINATNVISGASNLTQASTGATTLSGVNSYTGTTTVTSGTLSLSGGAAIVDTGAVVVTGGTLNLANSETIGSLAGNAGASVTLNANTLTTGDTTSTNFAGVISGTGNVTKQGSGTFTLSGTNNYSGTTNVNAGTLSLSGGSAIVDTGAVVVTGGTLNLANSETIGRLAGNAGTSVTLNANTLTTGDASSTAYAGVISGTGNVTKQGTGNFTLSGTNTYSGTTNVNAGTLSLSGGAAIVDTGAVVVNGGTLNLASSETIGSLAGAVGTAVTLNANTLTTGDASSTSYAGVISGTGSVTKQGTGTFTLTGANTANGTTAINAGTLLVNGSVQGTTNVNSGGTLGGTGSAGVVSVNPGGFFAPGSPTNTTDVFDTGDLSMNGTGAFVVQINGLTAGTQHDQANVTGTVTLGGTLTLSGTHIPVASQSFTILTNDGIDPVIGTFVGLPQGGAIANFLGSGLVAFINYSGGDGNDIVIKVNTTPILTISLATVAPSEGSLVTINASASDPDVPPDTITYSWTVTGPNAFSVSGTGAPVVFTPPDNGLYTATVTATDNYGAFDTEVLNVSVANIAPTATDTVTPNDLPIIARNAPHTFTLANIVDPAQTSDVYTITWDFDGNGTPEVTQANIPWAAASVGTFAQSYSFPNTGVFNVIVRLSDEDGGLTTFTYLVDVRVVVQVPNGDLLISGTGGNNNIVLDPGPTPNSVRVFVDNTYHGTFTLNPNDDTIRIFASTGIDTVTVIGTAAADQFEVAADFAPTNLADKAFDFNDIAITTLDAENYVLRGGDGADTFTVSGLGLTTAPSTRNVTLEGGNGADVLVSNLTAGAVGVDGETDWTIEGPERGKIEGVLSFTTMSALVGNNLPDNYKALTGGQMAGTATQPGITDLSTNNTLDLSSVTTAATFTSLTDGTMTTPAGKVSGITTLIGTASGSDRLLGATSNNTWNLTGTNAGTYQRGSAPTVTFSSIESLTGGGSTDTFNFLPGGKLTGSLDGGAGTDTASYATRLTNVDVVISSPKTTDVGGSWVGIESFIGGSGTNSLTAANATNLWTINGVNTGTLNALSFANFGILKGGTSSDQFLLVGAGQASSISGAAGTNTLSFAGVSSPVVVTLLATGSGSETRVPAFTGITSIVGGSGSDTLTATPNADTILITNANTGKINTTMTFTGFEMLNGGMGNDTYTLQTTSTSLSQIDNLGGSDTLVGANRANAWNLSAADTGTLNGMSFNNIRNLTGGTGVDTLTVGAGSLTGTFNGGSGIDILNVGAGDVNLQPKTATNIALFTAVESFFSAGGTLTGANTANTWKLTGMGVGTVNTSTAFNGFANINGGTLADKLQVYQGSLLGVFNAGGGTDTLDYSGVSMTRPYNVSVLGVNVPVRSGLAGNPNMFISNFELLTGNL